MEEPMLDQGDNMEDLMEDPLDHKEAVGRAITWKETWGAPSGYRLEILPRSQGLMEMNINLQQKGKCCTHRTRSPTNPTWSTAGATNYTFCSATFPLGRFSVMEYRFFSLTCFDFYI